MKALLMSLLLVSLIAVAIEVGAVQPHNLSGFQNVFNPSYSATIASSGTVSTVINTGGMTVVGVMLPATFTGTTLTFKASTDGINFFTVKSTTSGTSLSYTVAQGTYAALDPKDFYGIQYLEIVSGSTEGAARTLLVSLKGI